MRQRREPRSFPLTRRAELRAGPGLSQSLPPLRPDAQTWLGCTDGRPAERTAGRCARCDPGTGTRVAAASLASVASTGKRRGPWSATGRELGQGVSSLSGAVTPAPFAYLGSSRRVAGIRTPNPAANRAPRVGAHGCEVREALGFPSPPPPRCCYPEMPRRPKAGCRWQRDGARVPGG